MAQKRRPKKEEIIELNNNEYGFSLGSKILGIDLTTDEAFMLYNLALLINERGNEATLREIASLYAIDITGPYSNTLFHIE